MSYSIETIKSDIIKLSERDFYLKHIVRSDNWYFENVLDVPETEILHVVDDFKSVISETLHINFNSIMMVGSGKTGYSFSPNKLFKPFNKDENIRNISDIDIAIISDYLFDKYWSLFRKSYRQKYSSLYPIIYEHLYRGYINERFILEVEGCRKEWSEVASKSKKILNEQLYFKNEVSYRIYRNWADFEEYNLQTVKKIKRCI